MNTQKMFKAMLNRLKDRNHRIKFQMIFIAVFIFLLIGVTIFTRSLIQQEEKRKMKNMKEKGVHLVSLAALHSVNDFETSKRDFYLRTLLGYSSAADLVYCFVHDNTGKSIASFTSNVLKVRIPDEIEVRSLSSMRLTAQIFLDPLSEQSISEYSKPIFEGGQKTGTVRLGFRFPSVELFSPERISLLAMFALLIFAAVFLAYYGILYAIRPVQKSIYDIKNRSNGTGPVGADSAMGGGIARIVGDLNHSFSDLHGRLKKIESANFDLATKVGVVSFEKNKIINLLNAMDFGILTIDVLDNLSYINDYMSKLLGKELKDVIDRPLDSILGHDEIVTFILQHEIAESSNSAKHIETTFPDVSPGETFKMSFFNLKDNEGAVTGKMILLKNITNEKLGEKTQQEFIAHVSHELLTPLTTIKSYNEMLMDGEIDKVEMQKEFYNTISDETTRLTRLIQNLLNISKIEMGSLTINKGLIKTDLLFQDCASAISASALNKGIAFEKKVPDKFPSLDGDKELLKVAINNILNNAVKYTPEGGSITFSLNEQDTSVTFAITNTGQGISKEDIPHVFEKSYRSKDTHVTEQTGTGLGLAISAEIIQLHGGEIEVQSEPDKETRFTISMPKEEYYIENK